MSYFVTSWISHSSRNFKLGTFASILNSVAACHLPFMIFIRTTVFDSQPVPLLVALDGYFSEAF